MAEVPKAPSKLASTNAQFMGFMSAVKKSMVTSATATTAAAAPIAQSLDAHLAAIPPVKAVPLVQNQEVDGMTPRLPSAAAAPTAQPPSSVSSQPPPLVTSSSARQLQEDVSLSAPAVRADVSPAPNHASTAQSKREDESQARRLQPAASAAVPSSAQGKREDELQARRLQQAIDEKMMAQDEITRLSGMLAEQMQMKQVDHVATAQMKTMEEELKRLKGEIARTKDRIEYKKVEANELEIQKTREQSANLRAEVTRLSSEVVRVSDQSAAMQSAVSDLEKQLLASAEASSAAEMASAKSADDAAQYRHQVELISEELKEAAAERDSANAKLQMSREAISLEFKRDTAAINAKWADKEKQLRTELDFISADRNAQRAKVESLQKALEKANRKVKTALQDEIKVWGAEKNALLAELERKNRSLADAMEALQTRDATKRSKLMHDLEKQRKMPIASADVQLVEQNYAFQSISNGLIEAMKDKDALIAQLKIDNSALYVRVNELEEQKKKPTVLLP